MSRFKKINPRLVLIVLFILVVGVISYNLGKNNSDSSRSKNGNTASSQKPETKGKIKYPAGWTESDTLLPDEINANVILKVRRHNPDATVTARAQSGKLASDFKIEDLPDGVAKKLSKEINNFKLVDKKVTTVNKHKVVEIHYTDKNTVYNMIIFPFSNKTYYLTLSVDKGNYDKVSADYSKIQQAFGEYVTSQSQSN